MPVNKSAISNYFIKNIILTCLLTYLLSFWVTIGRSDNQSTDRGLVAASTLVRSTELVAHQWTSALSASTRVQS